MSEIRGAMDEQFFSTFVPMAPDGAAKAVQLSAILRKHGVWVRCMPRVHVAGDPDAVPNLGGGNESAAVEGILHHVLERLLGHAVAIDCLAVGGGLRWKCLAVGERVRLDGHEMGDGWHNTSRLEAIVEALFAFDARGEGQ